MREQLEEMELEEIVGGVVRVSGNKMKVMFTTLGAVYPLKNCDPSDASLVAQLLYSQHKDEGDLAFEQITLAEFQKRGWV